MRWLSPKNPPPAPTIPPMPETHVDPDALRDMEELVKVRSRRGKRTTRATQVAMAQNHFRASFKSALGVTPQHHGPKE